MRNIDENMWTFRIENSFHDEKGSIPIVSLHLCDEMRVKYAKKVLKNINCDSVFLKASLTTSQALEKTRGNFNMEKLLGKVKEKEAEEGEKEEKRGEKMEKKVGSVHSSVLESEKLLRCLNILLSFDCRRGFASLVDFYLWLTIRIAKIRNRKMEDAVKVREAMGSKLKEFRENADDASWVEGIIKERRDIWIFCKSGKELNKYGYEKWRWAKCQVIGVEFKGLYGILRCKEVEVEGARIGEIFKINNRMIDAICL